MLASGSNYAFMHTQIHSRTLTEFDAKTCPKEVLGNILVLLWSYFGALKSKFATDMQSAKTLHQQKKTGGLVSHSLGLMPLHSRGRWTQLINEIPRMRRCPNIAWLSSKLAICKGWDGLAHARHPDLNSRLHFLVEVMALDGRVHGSAQMMVQRAAVRLPQAPAGDTRQLAGRTKKNIGV